MVMTFTVTNCWCKSEKITRNIKIFQQKSSGFLVCLEHCEQLLWVWHQTISLVCWRLTSLCHSNGHIKTMPAREISPFTALTRMQFQLLKTQLSTSNHQRVDTTAPQTIQPSGLTYSHPTTPNAFTP